LRLRDGLAVGDDRERLERRGADALGLGLGAQAADDAGELRLGEEPPGTADLAQRDGQQAPLELGLEPLQGRLHAGGGRALQELHEARRGQRFGGGEDQSRDLALELLVALRLAGTELDAPALGGARLRLVRSLLSVRGGLAHGDVELHDRGRGSVPREASASRKGGKRKRNAEARREDAEERGEEEEDWVLRIDSPRGLEAPED